MRVWAKPVGAATHRDRIVRQAIRFGCGLVLRPLFKMASRNEYSYKKLEPGYIRLVAIYRGVFEVTYYLSEYPLEEALPRFEAISYRWGEKIINSATFCTSPVVASISLITRVNIYGVC